MRKFDTKVQFVKYHVLREVAKFAWEGTLSENLLSIPKIINPGNVATMRCCVYKERAILGERIKLAIGGDKTNPNIIEAIEIACDDCPMGGYEITGACRGCMARRCEDVCRPRAISFNGDNPAHIDKSKCVDCGLCAKVCPFNAIINHKRPCEQSCEVGAIHMSETKAAKIDNDKCISCGACVYQCPWGALMDKSFILDAIDIIKKSEDNQKYKTYAVVAPAVSSQFVYAKLGQVMSGIKKLGFNTIVEAAIGADMVAYAEATELAEKGFLTSSCCPAFVDYVKKRFPDLACHISHNLSPAAAIAKHIKENDKTAKVVFIGPCLAKKMERQAEAVSPYIDCVITFEELQALFDSKDIDISNLEESDLNDASSYGRLFARVGGLSDALEQAIREHKIENFELRAAVCDGIEDCRVELIKTQKKVQTANFIEGMACEHGCIGGAGCLTHGGRGRNKVESYSDEASKNTIKEALATFGIF